MATPVRNYLTERAALSPLANGLVLFLIYQHALQPHARSELILVALAGLAIAQLFGSPRWALYSLLLVAFVVQLHFLTQILANGTQDVVSTRDEALEGTAQALLNGENPWSHVAPLGAQATTGPASILLAVPFVAWFGEINWLSFDFWMLFFVTLLAFDVERQNESFPVLVLMFIVGELAFAHTLAWSLDELYYPYLLFGLSYVCLKRKWMVAAGALLGTTIMFRASYVFMAAGCLAWFLFEERRTRGELLRLAAGGATAIVLILAPFAIVGGHEFAARNAFSIAYGMSGAARWPETNLAFRLLNMLARASGPFGMRLIKLALMAVVLLVVSFRLRKAGHPFWHIAAPSLLTYTFAWYPPGQVGLDYALSAVLPAFMATACAAPRRSTS
jgi:hypothetical protein